MSHKMMGAGSSSKSVFTGREPRFVDVGQPGYTGPRIIPQPYRQEIERDGCTSCGTKEWPFVVWQGTAGTVIVCANCAEAMGKSLLLDAGRAQAIEDKG